MAKSNQPNRVYTPEEISELLEQAAQRQHAASTDVNADGLTLAEVQAAAEAAGIDPTYVAQVASDVQLQVTPAPTSGYKVFGPSTQYEVAVTVPHAADPDAFPTLRTLIRKAMGRSTDDTPRTGTSPRLQPTHLTWNHGTLNQVRVVPSEGETHVTGHGRWGAIAASIYAAFAGGGLAVASVLAAVLSPSGLAALGIYGVVFGASFLTARTLWARWARRARTRLHGAVQAVTRHLLAQQTAPAAARSIRSATPTTTSPTPSPTTTTSTPPLADSSSRDMPDPEPPAQTPRERTR